MRLAVAALFLAFIAAGCQSTRVDRDAGATDAGQADSFESDDGTRDSFESDGKGGDEAAIRRSFESEGDPSAKASPPSDLSLAVNEKAAALPSVLIGEAWVSDDFLPDELHFISRVAQ